MKRSTIFSIGVLISFFLPWIDLTFFTLSGYNIPTSLDKLNNIGNAFDKSDNSNIFKLSYLLYLIPICSVFNIIKDITGMKGTYFLNEFRLGILAVIIFFIAVNNINEKATSVLSIGYYLTALFSILGVFSYGNSKNVEIQAFQNKEEPKEALSISTDKTELLNQLSQLHSLKEKGVLTEEIYQQERQAILSQFQKSNTNESIEQPISNEELNTSTTEGYSPEYEELFGKKTWFEKNKTILFVVVISLAIVGVLYFVNFNKSLVKRISTSDNTALSTISKEAKWNIFWQDFQEAFNSKDKEAIMLLTSSDFFSGGSGDSIDSWCNMVFDSNNIEIYNAIKSEIEKGTKYYSFDNKTEEKVTGKANEGSLYFIFTLNYWQFGGIVGD